MGRPVLEVWGNSSRFIFPSCPLGIFHPTVALQWATEVIIVCTPNLIHSIRYHSPDRLLNNNNIFNVHSTQIQIYILVSLSFTKHQLIPLPFHQLCSKKNQQPLVRVTDHHITHTTKAQYSISQEQFSFYKCSNFSPNSKQLPQVTQSEGSRVGAKTESWTNISSLVHRLAGLFLIRLACSQLQGENSGWYIRRD